MLESYKVQRHGIRPTGIEFEQDILLIVMVELHSIWSISA
jgi:hypothetical protein